MEKKKGLVRYTRHPLASVKCQLNNLTRFTFLFRIHSLFAGTGNGNGIPFGLSDIGFDHFWWKEKEEHALVHLLIPFLSGHGFSPFSLPHPHPISPLIFSFTTNLIHIIQHTSFLLYFILLSLGFL